MDISKALVPAAGLGTRFLPWTKAVPKELLPLIDRPAFHHIVEELLKSSIPNVFIVTSRDKSAIADYFDASPTLEALLQERGKRDLINDIERITKTANFTYIRQSEPLGLGHAVLMAQQAINKEYFGICLPDDIIVSKQPALAQLIRIARQEKGSVIAVQEVPETCVSSYGVVAVKKQITPNLFQVSHLVEKPEQKDAPSNLAVIGRYVLSHKVFDSLEEIGSYAIDGELQLTDAISYMIKNNNEKLFAYKVQGTRYDLGTPLGWIKAVIGFALQDPRYAPAIKQFLETHGSIDSFMYDSTKNIEHTV